MYVGVKRNAYRTKYMKRTQGIMQAPDKKQSGQVVRKTTPPETNLPDGKAGLASEIAMYVDGNPSRRINSSEANT